MNLLKKKTTIMKNRVDFFIYLKHKLETCFSYIFIAFQFIIIV